MLDGTALDLDRLTRHGALHVPGLLDAAGVAALRRALAPLPVAGSRALLPGVAAVRELLAPAGALGRLAAAVLGEEGRPMGVRLFDKIPENNWLVSWHQDRAAPTGMLAGMVTIRLHLDDVDAANAPLLYAPGSHRFGWLPAREVEAMVTRCGIASSPAAAGDAWIYPTLILHASEPALRPTRRRVLHVDYAAGSLPGGLEWPGICRAAGA